MAARYGLTWWGRSWVDAVEQRSGVDEGRLDRGRTFAGQDRVDTMLVDPGAVTASVRGGRRLNYRTNLTIPTFDDETWASLVTTIAAKAGRTAALLDGDLDPSLLEDTAADGVDLLPSAGELAFTCSCPDREEPCKHAAALCYLVAEALDDDPFVLFLLRGRDRSALLDEVRAARQTSRETDDDADAAALARLVAAGPDGTGADPGESARQAWQRERVPLPAAPDLPDTPGAPATWPEDPPADAPFDTPGLLVLAADAAYRALAQLRGAGTSGLDLSMLDDIERRRDVPIRSLVPRSIAGGAGEADAADRATAWRHGGQEALDLLEEGPWTPPVADMAAARTAIEDAGVPSSVLTVTNNRITGPGFQLRVSRAGRWWRFEKRRGRWELSRPPADRPDALVH